MDLILDLMFDSVKDLVLGCMQFDTLGVIVATTLCTFLLLIFYGAQSAWGLGINFQV